MKKLYILLLGVGLANIFVNGCLVSCDADREIKAVMYENIQALNKEDLEKSMATIHEESPAYATTEQMTKQLFVLYDLKYELQDVKVIEKSEREVKVKYVQMTKKIVGPEFKDNKLKAVAILRKSDGKWKIYNTIIKGFEYLD